MEAELRMLELRKLELTLRPPEDTVKLEVSAKTEAPKSPPSLLSEIVVSDPYGNHDC